MLHIFFSRLCLLFVFLQLCITESCFAYGSEEIFRKFPNKYFIESGSLVGDGIQQALNTGCFQTIHSIELSEMYYLHVCDFFKNSSSVVLWQGNSGEVLKDVLALVDAPATFWLDAHYSGGETAMGESLSPILQELECIKNHFIHTHVILIDDVRQFGTVDFDYVTRDEIVNKIMEINPNYTIEFLDCPCTSGDVLAAYIK